jgi:hypothetical protein
MAKIDGLVVILIVKSVFHFAGGFMWCGVGWEESVRSGRHSPSVDKYVELDTLG